MNRAVGAAGLACLAFGWVLALSLLWAKFGASQANVFAQIKDGLSPRQDLYAFDCPDILGEHETGRVEATLLNPTALPLNYRIQIEAHKTGGVGIKVKALSEEDLSRHPPPSPPAWSTSYSQGCGIGVGNLLGLTAGQATWISRGSLVGGFVLTTWWVYTRWAERRKRTI